MRARGSAYAFVAAVFAAFLWAAAYATAAERVAVSVGEIYEGPYLSGDRVAWRDSVCSDYCDPLYGPGEDSSTNRLWITRPGGAPVVLDKSEYVPYDGGGEDPPAPGITHDLAVSGGWMIRNDGLDLDAYENGDASGNRRLRAGRVGTRLPTLYRCTYTGLRPSEGSEIVLDSNVLAYRAGACRRGRAPLVVRDLATRREWLIRQPLGGSLSVAALSGRYLLTYRSLDAPGKPDGVNAGRRLLDWRTGRVLTDIAPSRDAENSIAVGPDGTVAAVRTAAKDTRDDRCLGSVTLYRPPTYVPRVIGHRACGPLHVVRRGVLFRTDSLPGDTFTRRTSGIREVARSGRARTVARFGAGEGTVDFAADGRSVAFGLQRCDGRQDLIRLHAAEREYRSGTLACPVRFPDSTVRAEGKRARALVRCPHGCKGVLYVIRGKRRLVAGRVRGNGVIHVALPLTHLGARFVRHHRAVRGRFRAVVLDRSGNRRTYRGRALLRR